MNKYYDDFNISDNEHGLNPEQILMMLRNRNFLCINRSI